MGKNICLLVFLAGLSACARASSIPLSNDTVQISVTAAPACGGAGAAGVASRQAAIETIRRGFDRYMIMGSEGQNNTGVGYAWNRYGGTAVPMGTHDHGLLVKMFKEGDPKGVNAISARQLLGPNWAEAVQSQTVTCM
jgi:hypothetical protein